MLRVDSPTLPGAQREYTITCSVPPPSHFRDVSEVTFDAVVTAFTEQFVARIKASI